MVLLLGSVFLSLSGLVSAVTNCWTGESILPTATSLSDLRTASLFTYLDFVSVYNCSVDVSVLSYTGVPTYYTTWYNAVIGTTTFPCGSSVVESFTIDTSTSLYETYIFPGLTVTSLTPGEIIVMSWTQLPPITGVSTGYYNIYVPTNAVTLKPTTATPSPTASTATATSPNTAAATVVPTSATPSPSSSGSSINVGAVAGGAIGGVVLLGAIFIFAWYKIRTRSDVPPQRNSINIPPEMGQYNDPGPGPGPQGGAAAMGGGYYGGKGGAEEQVMPLSPSLRYPEEGIRSEIPSGNVGNTGY